MDDQTPVVGIGASAGGLEALTELVGAIPEDSGIAFVIVQHLSPDHPSMMDQLLANHTRLPVRVIEEGMRLAPDTIYVLPPRPWVTLEGETLHLHDRDPDEVLRTPIDNFLVSLADARGRNAFAVILSGTGSDGTHGVRSVKAQGGFAIVQESDSAQFPGMPDSAAATGMVDFVLPPHQIPGRLIDIIRHRERFLTDDEAENLREAVEQALPDILSKLASEDGYDFTNYKPGTLIRRIERRMTVLRERDVDRFIDRLAEDEQERDLLLQDFLIGVTRFFRDEDAFEKLRQEAILPLLDSDRESLRIWIPGCSTGEEAYSIAMLLTEAMEAAGDRRKWQIFGTDIDTHALRTAREGTYSESEIAALSPERRRRFLTALDSGYQIKPELREHCVFAPHNLLQDPPFSRLDLISCRNLLIYLNSNAQDELFPRFHYALNESGFLFLGPSESLGRQENFFDLVDREARLFRRDDSQPAAFSSLAMTSAKGVRREMRLSGSPTRPVTTPPQDTSLDSQLVNFFVRQSAPPFAAINSSDEIVYLSEPMSRFIRPTQGQPSAAIDEFMVRDLRLPVRSAVSEARETGRTANMRDVAVAKLAGETGFDVIDVEARPLPFAEGSILVTLRPVRTESVLELASTIDERSEEERDQVEQELALARRQLNALRSDFESSEQDLKSSNEELLSMNEELQSSNEELETSREELQSINEELETVNAELSENNKQLQAVNSDLLNLFDSTEIATVFLDQALNVRRFTPASRRLFGIRDRDIGRSINDLKWRVSYDDLENDAADVQASLQPVEREVRIEATNETFLMRIRPYRRTDDRIDGTVLTFFDITERKRSEKQLAENAETLTRQFAELETLYQTTPVGLSLIDREMRYLRINERLAEINGIPREDHIGRTQAEMLPDIDEKIRDLQLRVLETGEPSYGNEVHGTTPAKPNVERDWVVDYFPVRTPDGEIFALGNCVTEVTEQKRLQRELEATLGELAENESLLRLFIEKAPAAIAMFDREMCYIACSDRWVQSYELPADEPLTGELHPEVAKHLPKRFITAHERALDAETTEVVEDSFTWTDGSTVYVSWRLVPWTDRTGAIGGSVLFTEIKTAEVEAKRSLERSEARLGFALETAQLGAWELAADGSASTRTIIHDRIMGYEELQEDWSLDRFFGHVIEEEREKVRELVEKALAEGDGWKFECQIDAADGHRRWVEAHGRPQRDGDGNLLFFSGTLQDITERKEARIRQEILLHELQHRVKNSLANTLAILQLSSRNANDVEKLVDALRGRLQAIARTHDKLLGDEWQSGWLSDILREEFAPYRGKDAAKVNVSGDDLELSVKQMLSLTLAMHELVNNSVKYGALSSKTGSVTVNTTVTDGRVFVRWEETGGPPVREPYHDESGFGSLLLSKIAGPDLKGETKLVFDSEGVVWTADFPIWQKETTEEEAR